MVKPEWGMRHVCHNCGVSFYDMNKPQATCPKCDAKQAKKKTSRKAASAAAKPKPRKLIAVDPEVEDKVTDENENELHDIGFDKISGENDELDEGR